MDYKEISRFLSKYLFFFSLTLFIPYLIALYYHYVKPEPQPYVAYAFLWTIAVTLFFAALLGFLGKGSKGLLHRKESILIVALIWILTAFVSALPFYFSKTLNFLDSYFEATSGITTTGASMMMPKAYLPGTDREVPIYLTNYHVPNKTYAYYGTIKPVKDRKGDVIFTGVEAVNKALLFWRSFLQWIGGLGIIVIVLTVLPALTVGGKYLYHMEYPGPVKDTFLPRIRETASVLWKIYLSLTIAQIFFLIWTNSKMPVFDAFTIALSTISGGGFSVRNASIEAYHSHSTVWVTTIFMIASGVNFALYFHLVKGKIKKFFDPDLLFFLLIVVVSSLLIAYNISGTYDPSTSIREGFFSAVSAQTTNGLITKNYDLWPFPSQIILLILMFVGGMAGSGAGGIKTSRIYILFKIIKNRLESILHPDIVKRLSVGSVEIDNKTSLTVLSFFSIVILFAVLSTLYFVYTGIDPETAVGLVACMMNNVGMAFRAAGPEGAFNILSPSGEIVSIILMLLGRLEFFTILILFLPSFWMKR